MSRFFRIVGLIATIVLLFPIKGWSANFTLVLDVSEPGQYGWGWGSRLNKEKVTAVFESAESDLDLAVTGYDIDNGTEVAIELNGTRVGYLPKGTNNGLSSSTVRLPQSQQVAGLNTLEFVQSRAGWKWGVTDVLITDAQASVDFVLIEDVSEPGQYGWGWGSRLNKEKVTAVFESAESDLDLAVTGYDIDNGTEVAIELNGTRVGYLPKGTNNGLSSSTVRLPQSQQVAGLNTLEFVQRRAGWKWGVTDLLLRVHPDVNVAPMAVNDSVDAAGEALTVAIGSPLTIAVLLNDSDSDSDGALDVTSVVTSLEEEALAQLDGTIVYTPAEGTDTENDVTFTYTVKDLEGAESDPATVTIIVTPYNGQPVAVEDSVEGGILSGVVIDVAANDTDDGSVDVATVAEAVEPSHGSISVNPTSGSISYTPDGSVAIGAQDQFSYTIKDNLGLISDPGGVQINFVAHVLKTTKVKVPVTIDTFSYFDGLPDGVTVDTNFADEHDWGSQGYLKLARSTGILTFANYGEVGEAIFRYQLFGSSGEPVSDVITVKVSITSDDEPSGTPNPFVDGGEVPFDGSITFNAMTNGVNLDPESVTITSQASEGTAVAQADGTIIYTHNGESNESTDAYTYTVVDNFDVSTDVVVTLSIGANPNLSSYPVDDTFLVTSNQQKALNVLDNDYASSASIDLASIAIVQQPTYGALLLSSDGLMYTGNIGATSDSFTYALKYGEGMTSDPATVNITIRDAPKPRLIHRHGQTFLTWAETAPSDSYHVYRSVSPITQASLGAATRLTESWGPLDSDTSVNIHGGANVPANFVIEDLAAPLGDEEGLFVYTTQSGESGPAYYAVTSVNNGIEDVGSLQASDVVTESVAIPRDVLTVSVNGGRGRIYTQYMDYSNWNPTFNGYVYNYAVALPSGFNSAQSYPLSVEPHAYGSYFKFEDQTEYGWQVIQLFPHDPGTQVGADNSWWYGYASDHDYRSGTAPTSGNVIENFTEQRVMRSIDELIINNDFTIDEQRIHAFGNSMGASAAISWGMRYPSVITAVYAGQPMMNYAESSVFISELELMWGAKSDNLPTVNRGPRSGDISVYGETGSQSVGVWDWMDHHAQLVERRGDEFAFLMTSHGKADAVIGWENQGEPTVQAFTDASIGFAAVYSMSDHNWANFDAVIKPMFGADLPWIYPLNLSFPAIQNASGSSAVTPGNSGVDKYNLNIEWATEHTRFDDPIVDLPDQYEITLRSTATFQQTADITPRRVQQFSVDAGDTCHWTVTDRDTGVVFDAGDIVVDIDSLVTVSDVIIKTVTGTRLAIICPAGVPGDPEPTVDAGTVLAGGSSVFHAMVNGSNLDSDTVSVTSQPSAGSVDVQPDGTIIYTHDGVSNDTTDSYTYTVTDNNGVSTVVIVTVGVDLSNANNNSGATEPKVTATPAFCPAGGLALSSLNRPRSHTIIVTPDMDDWEREIMIAPEGSLVLMETGEYILDRQDFVDADPKNQSLKDKNSIWLSNPNVTIRSRSGNREDVIIKGDGYPIVANQLVYYNSDNNLVSINDGIYRSVDTAFQIAADGITIADLTIRDMQNHAISMHPEAQADLILEDTYIYNVHLYDIGTQHIKGNALYEEGSAEPISTNLTPHIACSLIEYSIGAAVGDYNGGIDIHAAADTVIRDNKIYNINGDGTGCSAADYGNCPRSVPYESAPAIYMLNSSDTIVERNIVGDSFRGISLGLVGFATHTGGIVNSNFVYRSDDGDMGISIAGTTNAVVENNTVIVEGYSGPIEEYESTGTIFRNNLTNKPIELRSGPGAVGEGNIGNADNSYFDVDGNFGYELNPNSSACHLGVVPDTVVYDIEGDTGFAPWHVGSDKCTHNAP